MLLVRHLRSWGVCIARAYKTALCLSFDAGSDLCECIVDEETTLLSRLKEYFIGILGGMQAVPLFVLQLSALFAVQSCLMCFACNALIVLSDAAGRPLPAATGLVWDSCDRLSAMVLSDTDAMATRLQQLCDVVADAMTELQASLGYDRESALQRMDMCLGRAAWVPVADTAAAAAADAEDEADGAGGDSDSDGNDDDEYADEFDSVNDAWRLTDDDRWRADAALALVATAHTALAASQAAVDALPREPYTQRSAHSARAQALTAAARELPQRVDDLVVALEPTQQRAAVLAAAGALRSAVETLCARLREAVGQQQGADAAADPVLGHCECLLRMIAGGPVSARTAS